MKWIRAYPWLDASHQLAILLTFIILSNELVSEGEYLFIWSCCRFCCCCCCCCCWTARTLKCWLSIYLFIIVLAVVSLASWSNISPEINERIESMITVLSIWLKFVTYWRVCIIIDRQSCWMAQAKSSVHAGETIAWKVFSSKVALFFPAAKADNSKRYNSCWVESCKLSDS